MEHSCKLLPPVLSLLLKFKFIPSIHFFSFLSNNYPTTPELGYMYFTVMCGILWQEFEPSFSARDTDSATRWSLINGLAFPWGLLLVWHASYQVNISVSLLQVLVLVLLCYGASTWFNVPHPGGIYNPSATQLQPTRLLLVWTSSSSTLSCFQITELQWSPDTPLPVARGHRWGQGHRLARKSTTLPVGLVLSLPLQTSTSFLIIADPRCTWASPLEDAIPPQHRAGNTNFSSWELTESPELEVLNVIPATSHSSRPVASWRSHCLKDIGSNLLNSIHIAGTEMQSYLDAS